MIMFNFFTATVATVESKPTDCPDKVLTFKSFVVLALTFDTDRQKMTCQTGQTKLNCAPLIVLSRINCRTLRDLINIPNFNQHAICTNLLTFGPLQDDCSTAGMFDPILATLEVYPLPAEALEGVQARTGCSQEGRHKTSPAATEARLT